MHFDTELQRLRSENDHLQARIEDLEYLIGAREEELNLLRIKASEVIELKSSLENRLLELEQLRNRITEASLNEMRAGQREAAMEKELLQSIAVEKELLLTRQKESTARNESEYLQQELKDALEFHALADELKKRVSQLESRLGMAAWEQAVKNSPQKEENNPVSNPMQGS